MKDLVQIVPVFSDGFWEWAREKILSQITPNVHGPGSVIPVVTDEPPEQDLGMDIRPDDLLQVNVKILGPPHQVIGIYRPLRPEEMRERAEAFLHHIVQSIDCFNWNLPRPTVSTFDGGLNGGIELNVGKSKERGDIEQTLLISACLDLGDYPCKNGLAYTIENEGGNSEPRNPSFLGALCRALEIFYSWQLYDAQQAFEKESE